MPFIGVTNLSHPCSWSTEVTSRIPWPEEGSRRAAQASAATGAIAIEVR
jgi:hypothetical protein